MGKVNCMCGEWQISDVASPCREKGWLLRDYDVDENEDALLEDVISIGVDVWECKKCGRLAIGNNNDNTVIWYEPIVKTEDRLMDWGS